MKHIGFLSVIALPINLAIALSVHISVNQAMRGKMNININHLSYSNKVMVNNMHCYIQMMMSVKTMNIKVSHANAN